MNLEEILNKKLAETKEHQDIKLSKKIETLIKIWENISLEENSIDKVIVMPNLNYGYSDIFLMADCESDNPHDWKKIELDGEQIDVNIGDIIIKFK